MVAAGEGIRPPIAMQPESKHPWVRAAIRGHISRPTDGSCRPERATGIAAGTSVAVNGLDRQQTAKLPPAQLRCSGRYVGDLVPAYVRNAG